MRQRLGQKIRFTEWWDFSVTADTEAIFGGVTRPLGLRPLQHRDIVHDELPLESVQFDEVLLRRIEEAGEGALEDMDGKVKELVSESEHVGCCESEFW